jgi:hypothetical protein
MNITGAYGRKYENEEAVTKDWKAGKDFKIHKGPYLSIRDQVWPMEPHVFTQINPMIIMHLEQE